MNRLDTGIVAARRTAQGKENFDDVLTPEKIGGIALIAGAILFAAYSSLFLIVLPIADESSTTRNWSATRLGYPWPSRRWRWNHADDVRFLFRLRTDASAQRRRRRRRLSLH